MFQCASSRTISKSALKLLLSPSSTIKNPQIISTVFLKTSAVSTKDDTEKRRQTIMDFVPVTLPSPAELVAQAPKHAQPYLRLVRADKPIGTWLLYLPCTWGLALGAAPGLPSVSLLALFGAGSFLMRGAGCAINDLWDQDFDKKVSRTRNRPLASGELKSKQAFLLLGGLLSSSLLILCQLNALSIAVCLPSVALVATYPLAKRFTNNPQLVLGLTFNWGALVGYTATCNSLDWGPMLSLYSAGVFWTLTYDTIYAHQDMADDRIVGVKSLALFLDNLGGNTKTWLRAFSVGTIGSLVAAGLYTPAINMFYFPLLVFPAYEFHKMIKNVNLKKEASCWNAFRINRNIGGLIFAIILLGGLKLD